MCLLARARENLKTLMMSYIMKDREMANEREELVKQVKADVLREMAAQRGDFSVEDFAGRLKEFSLSASRNAMWKIKVDYDTASGVLDSGGQSVEQRAGWKVGGSYDTSDGPKLTNISGAASK